MNPYLALALALWGIASLVMLLVILSKPNGDDDEDPPTFI